VIHSSSVDLIFSAKDGRAKTLRVAHTGQILGLSSVFSHRPHDYTATARSTSDLGFVDEVAFHKLLETSPALLFGVLRLLSEDVNSCYECSSFAHSVHARDRAGEVGRFSSRRRFRVSTGGEAAVRT